MFINKKQARIVIILFVSTAITTTIAIANVTLAQSNSDSTPTTTSVKVQAGGGNSTLPYTIFNPQSVQVKAGQSIMWYNPSKVGEPHTVTFALDNKTRPDLSATFAVRNSSSFTPIPSNSASEPTIVPNHQNPSMSMILGSNAIASNPVVIDSAGNVKHLGHNAAYSVKGNEKLVNSGLVFPKGMGPPNGSTSFTLTFEKAGTYNYYCILHPWQKGKVVVQ